MFTHFVNDYPVLAILAFIAVPYVLKKVMDAARRCRNTTGYPPRRDEDESLSLSFRR